jgi:hypothetical protein
VLSLAAKKTRSEFVTKEASGCDVNVASLQNVQLNLLHDMKSHLLTYSLHAVQSFLRR